MNGRARAMLLTAAKVALAAAIISFILWKKVDPRAFAANLRGLSRGGLIACAGIYGAILLLNAWRWRLLIRCQGIGARYRAVLEYFFIGLFFNNIMFGSMGGDVVKAYYLGRAAPDRKGEAVASVVADRFAGFISFFLIGLLGVALNGRAAALRPVSVIFLVMFAGAGIVLAAAAQRSLLARVPLLKGILRRLPFEDAARRFYEALLGYRRRGALLAKVVLLSVCIQLLFIGNVRFIVWLMGIEGVSFSHLLLLIPVIGTVFAIPVTPSGWGTGEYAFVRLFALLGVSADRALAVDLVMRAMLIAWSLIGGLLYGLPGRHPARRVT
ncbi:MAG: lysylphosphatidylglycerol synthase transmembrane domain-containing protein [bacterium]|nr:lysylphosphatidylglycerol synthase transmembrane domain-containing protein [bacterium]